MMKTASFVACASGVVALALSAGTAAQIPVAGTSGDLPAATTAALADPPMVLGEVRKIDREQGKLTLKHGPIAKLEMPGMTMVFRVSDPKMLDKLQAGDRVRFLVDKVNGAYTVTAIELAR